MAQCSLFFILHSPFSGTVILLSAVLLIILVSLPFRGLFPTLSNVYEGVKAFIIIHYKQYSILCWVKGAFYDWLYSEWFQLSFSQVQQMDSLIQPHSTFHSISHSFVVYTVPFTKRNCVCPCLIMELTLCEIDIKSYSRYLQSCCNSWHALCC
jgi:hypothetical protein